MKEEIIKKIAGGAVVVILGGSAFAVSQSDVIDNFSQESGMSQEQAQEYVDSIQDELATFSEIGVDTKTYGQDTIDVSNSLDCYNYTYEWVTTYLTCEAGKTQLYKIGVGEVSLGDCYSALDSDLGDGAKSKIQECIDYIDQSNMNLNLPIITSLYTIDEVTNDRNTNNYNKSVLKTALESE